MILKQKKQSWLSMLEKRTGYDVTLVFATLCLCIIGVVFVMTSSSVYARQHFGGDSMAITRSHLIRLAPAVILMLLLSFIDYKHLRRYVRPILLIGVVGLVAVLFTPQRTGATAHRWLNFFGFSFQPAELAKYALVAYLAMKFSTPRRESHMTNLRTAYVGCSVITLFIVLLILAEPNLSMACLVLGVAALLYFLSGIGLRRVMLGSAVLLPVLSAVMWLTPYMRKRMSPFFSGILDPVQAGYQVKQSVVGIGHGGFLGVGFGASTQKHLFLPEPHKDFIFSIIAEEIGLIGSAVILALFIVVLIRAWRVARNAPDAFGYFLAAGITCCIGLSFIVNIGVSLGLLPATGQPLPMISFGGSSLLVTLGSIGILLNISRQALRRPSFECDLAVL